MSSHALKPLGSEMSNAENKEFWRMAERHKKLTNDKRPLREIYFEMKRRI